MQNDISIQRENLSVMLCEIATRDQIIPIQRKNVIGIAHHDPGITRKRSITYADFNETLAPVQIRVPLHDSMRFLICIIEHQNETNLYPL